MPKKETRDQNRMSLAVTHQVGRSTRIIALTFPSLDQGCTAAYALLQSEEVVHVTGYEILNEDGSENRVVLNIERGLTMPDCSAARIEIGGTIKSVEALADLLKELQPYSGEYGSPVPDCWLREIARHAEARTPIIVCESEQPGGQFPELEAACEKHGLHYHRADDGHYAYAATNTRFNPDCAPEGKAEAGGNTDTGPTVPLHHLKELVFSEDPDELRTFLKRAIALWSDVPPISVAPGIFGGKP